MSSAIFDLTSTLKLDSEEPDVPLTLFRGSGEGQKMLTFS
jgi:hypothetical protein